MRITGRKEVSYEKKQRNRRWFSLLLGICLLVSMQLSAFAESQSAEGIPEAVTTGSGQLQEQSGKAEEQSAGNGQIQAEEQTAENRQTSRNELFQGRLKQKFIFVTVMKCPQPSIMHLLWENLALQEMTSHISQ